MNGLADSEVVHRIRDPSHWELGKYVNVLVLYTGGTIGMYGTEDGQSKQLCRVNACNIDVIVDR